MNDPNVSIALISPTPTSPAPTATARPVAARTKLLLEGPILPTLLRLSAPNVLNLLAIAGMITFDGLFLGRLGPDVLAGASLAFPFVMLIQHTAASGMGGGVSSAIARALGAGKRDVADALTLHTFVLALGLAAAFSTVLLLGAPFVFRWMGGHGEMLSAALAYSNVAFSGAVSICMLNLLGSAVRGTGNMSLPAVVIVGAVIAHVVISPLLIFGWGPLPALGPHAIRARQPTGPVEHLLGLLRVEAIQAFGRGVVGKGRSHERTPGDFVESLKDGFVQTFAVNRILHRLADRRIADGSGTRCVEQ